MSTVLVTGNTYPVKDQIKALGGRWDANAKGWNVPAHMADQARALVNAAPQSSSYRPSANRRTRSSYNSGAKCSCCGSRSCDGAFGGHCDED